MTQTDIGYNSWKLVFYEQPTMVLAMAIPAGKAASAYVSNR